MFKHWYWNIMHNGTCADHCWQNTIHFYSVRVEDFEARLNDILTYHMYIFPLCIWQAWLNVAAEKRAKVF